MVRMRSVSLILPMAPEGVLSRQKLDEYRSALERGDGVGPLESIIAACDNGDLAEREVTEDRF